MRAFREPLYTRGMQRDSVLNTGASIGRYTIDGKLGEGGMAVVYRARHHDLGSLHAIKVLHQGGRAVRERLLLEGRVQASLSHPNIFSVTDVIDVDGAPGLVMELIDGPTLDELITSGALSWEEIDRLATGILRGVSAAHRKGLVHRELKPANVLVALQDGDMVPKVADFGLAKALEDVPAGPVHTRTGMAMGTPAYMSPEQVRDSKHVDHRADIW